MLVTCRDLSGRGLQLRRDKRWVHRKDVSSTYSVLRPVVSCGGMRGGSMVEEVWSTYSALRPVVGTVGRKEGIKGEMGSLPSSASELMWGSQDLAHGSLLYPSPSSFGQPCAVWDLGQVMSLSGVSFICK